MRLSVKGLTFLLDNKLDKLRALPLQELLNTDDLIDYSSRCLNPLSASVDPIYLTSSTHFVVVSNGHIHSKESILEALASENFKCPTKNKRLSKDCFGPEGAKKSFVDLPEIDEALRQFRKLKDAALACDKEPVAVSAGIKVAANKLITTSGPSARRRWVYAEGEDTGKPVKAGLKIDVVLKLPRRAHKTYYVKGERILIENRYIGLTRKRLHIWAESEEQLAPDDEAKLQALIKAGESGTELDGKKVLTKGALATIKHKQRKNLAIIAEEAEEAEEPPRQSGRKRKVYELASTSEASVSEEMSSNSSDAGTGREKRSRTRSMSTHEEINSDSGSASEVSAGLLKERHVPFKPEFPIRDLVLQKEEDDAEELLDAVLFGQDAPEATVLPAHDVSLTLAGSSESVALLSPLCAFRSTLVYDLEGETELKVLSGAGGVPAVLAHYTGLKFFAPISIEQESISTVGPGAESSSKWDLNEDDLATNFRIPS